jgi:hypothetical protein
VPLGARLGLDERGTGRLADLVCGEDLRDPVSSEQVVELSRLIESARASGLTGAGLRVAVDTAAAITTTRRPAARCCRPSSPARSEPRHPPATAGNMSRWRTLELLVRRCSDITATAADGPLVCAVTGSGLRAMTPVDPKLRTA